MDKQPFGEERNGEEMRRSVHVAAIMLCVVAALLAGCVKTTQTTTLLEPPKSYTGVWEVKDSNGRLIEIKTYANGQLHGPYVNWYGNGNLHWVYNFSLGQPKGRQITFSQEGEILDSSVK
jgi:hypothetical protein